MAVAVVVVVAVGVAVGVAVAEWFADIFHGRGFHRPEYRIFQ